MAAAGDAWSGRIGFILVTVGSAVGIGSIWKFPYEVGANGGAAFILFYLLGLALIVVPLMLAEFAIGRCGRADPRTSIAAIAAAHRASGWWALVGTAGAATAFLILSFYAVIGGWTIAYAAQTALAGLPATAPAVQARYAALLASPLAMLGYHAVFMAATAAIVARGIAGGIEAACKVLMPVLVALMLLLAAYALVEGDAAAALRFLFKLDLERMTAGAALDALGLGFFSIGVGLGLMITYAAYSGAEVNLKEVVVASVVADTAISFLAGLAVFPVVFAHGLDPGGGPGLVFVTLPLAFAGMPLGTVAAAAFFLLLFVAALASAISLLEIVVATLMGRAGLRRAAATAVAAGTCFAAGLATVLSFNLWTGWYPLALLPGFERATVFDLLDYLTSNVLLPLGGLAIALFAGWAMPARLLAGELGLGPAAARALRVLLRYVAPLAIAATAVSPWVVAAAKRV